jgi:hypothetical protein
LNGETKGAPCSVEGVACDKTCGPKSVGWKAETCVGGFFMESDCMFDPTVDYSCFRLSDLLLACDPVGPVQAAQPCFVLDCTPCGPDYLDSAGTAKVGYCVCNGGDGVNPGTWSCAAATAWPPQ